MNKPNHTPGEWKAVDGRAWVEDKPRWMVERRDGGHKSLIAFCDIEPAAAHGGTAEGNARLIAASPALVKALRDLCDAVDAHCKEHNWGGGFGVTHAARAALSRAEGGAAS